MIHELILEQVSQSVGDNMSKVHFVWNITKTASSSGQLTANCTVWLNRSNGNAFNPQSDGSYTAKCPLETNKTVTVLDTYINVPHLADGTGYVTVRVNSKYEKRLDLDTIQRHATIEAFYGVTGYFTGKIHYLLTPTAPDLFTVCDIVFGSSTIRRIENEQMASIFLTEEELAGIYNLLPNSNEGKIALECTTYGGSKTLKVGDTQHCDITLLIPDDDGTKPTATMTLSPVDADSVKEEMASVKGADNPLKSLYIKGRTRVKAAFAEVEGKFNATGDATGLLVEGKIYGPPFISGILNTEGQVAVAGIVEDSRGFKREITQNIEVLSYTPPKLIPADGETEIVCGRCNEHGTLVSNGTYLKVKASRVYSALVAGGEQKNFCEIRYRYKEDGEEDFSDWATLLDKTAETDTVDSVPLAGVVPSAVSAYVVQVGVIDDMGESSFVQFRIASDFVSIDLPKSLKGRRMGLMGYAKESNAPGIDVGVPIYGGSVDSLKIGTALSASAETPLTLNNLKTPGCYYSPGKEVSQYITDSPYTDGGFGLKVREIDSESNIQQILFYGRTRWERSCISDEWSQWACPIMVDASNTTDYVVDYGEDSHWMYRKWDSGFAECYGTFKQKVNCTNAWGSLYYGSCEVVDYPLEFVGMPVCNVSVEQYTYDSKSVWLASLAPATATSPCRPIIVSVDSQQANIVLHYHAIGRWK